MKKPLKYRNVPVEIDGIRFASKAEGRRYGELKMLEKAGKIHGLRLQPRYDLRVNGEKVCAYVGDFEYREHPKGMFAVCEDVKGAVTPVFRIKAKLFQALYPDIELRVIS